MTWWHQLGTHGKKVCACFTIRQSVCKIILCFEIDWTQPTSTSFFLTESYQSAFEHSNTNVKRFSTKGWTGDIPPTHIRFTFQCLLLLESVAGRRFRGSECVKCMEQKYIWKVWAWGVAAVYTKAHFSSMWHSPCFITEQSTRKNWTRRQYNFPALDLSLFPHLFPSPTEWNSFTSYQPSWWYGCRTASCGRTVCASWFKVVMSCLIHDDEDHNGWWHDMIENRFLLLKIYNHKK